MDTSQDPNWYINSVVVFLTLLLLALFLTLFPIHWDTGALKDAGGVDRRFTV